MKEYITSDTTGRTYCPGDVLRLVNVKQVATYALHGLEILDFYPSRDFKTNEPIIVFIVDKNKSKELYDKWCNFELH